jgi:hypothetical protein
MLPLRVFGATVRDSDRLRTPIRRVWGSTAEERLLGLAQVP